MSEFKRSRALVHGYKEVLEKLAQNGSQNWGFKIIQNTGFKI
jgi:hypothetical protein